MGTVRLFNPEEQGLKNEIQIFEESIGTEAKSRNNAWWYPPASLPTRRMATRQHPRVHSDKGRQNLDRRHTV